MQLLASDSGPLVTFRSQILLYANEYVVREYQFWQIARI
jgi:hypothetical protein